MAHSDRSPPGSSTCAGTEPRSRTPAPQPSRLWSGSTWRDRWIRCCATWTPSSAPTPTWRPGSPGSLASSSPDGGRRGTAPARCGGDNAGHDATRLGDAFFSEENLPVLLHPALVALCAATDELVHLGVLSGSQVVYLD